MKNVSTLDISVKSFNEIIDKPRLILNLRKLTLNSFSGMNRELNHLLESAKHRQVSARVILVHQGGQLVAWALMSKEETSFRFRYTGSYHPSDGFLLEMYVHPDFRRQGIGTELMKIARRKAGPYRLCVAPWDDGSEAFFCQFRRYKNKWL